MKDIIPHDLDGNKVTTLVQWDKDVVLTFQDPGFTTAHPVHFFNRNSDLALVVESHYENGILSAKIPNKLLRERHALAGYIDIIDVNGERCLYGFKIRILPKPTPSDIVYVESNDYVSLVSISKECRAYANSAEVACGHAEAAQTAAASSETNAANSAASAEAAKADAETAAEQAKQYSESIAGAVESTSRDAEAANTAKEQAVAAKNASETAQSKAEAARDAASASEAAAEASAVGAATSEANAGDSAADAARSASNAAASASDASVSATNASNSATAARLSEINASDAASRSDAAALRAEVAAADAESYSSGVSMTEVDITIPVDAWIIRQPSIDVNDEGPGSNYSVKATIHNQMFFARLKPIVTIDMASFEIATEAGIFPCASTSDGGLSFWAIEVPSGPVSAHVVLLSNNGT